MRESPIYLDHHATTPVDARVLERMLPYFSERFGNAASSSHRFGWNAAHAVDHARAQVAQLVGARPSEIVFTSGATEANNIAILGAARAAPAGRDHIITQVTEHKAVLDTVDWLEQTGFRVTRLAVDAVGRIRLEDLERALDERTLLVSIMLANNEIGTVQPIAEISAACRAAGAIMHCDATQGVGWQRVHMGALGIDLASFSAHKIYGPKGVGALYVRRGAGAPALAPVVFGGGHERGLRSGTLNVPAIVGFGEACSIALEEGEDAAARMRLLRDRLERGIVDRLAGVYVNGCPDDRHPGNLNLALGGVHSDAILGSLQDIAFSAGSACTSATAKPSHVIAALGRTEELVRGSVRFGLGRSTTEEEVEYVADRFVRVVERLRQNPGARTWP